MRMIDADALKDLIHSKSNGPEDLWDTMGVLNAINNSPTVDVYTTEQVKELVELNKKLQKLSEKRPQGKWIVRTEYDGFVHAQCDQCGKFWDVETNFCPNCGAPMEGSEEE